MTEHKYLANHPTLNGIYIPIVAKKKGENGEYDPLSRDDKLVSEIIKHDRCGYCSQKLLRGRWFVGPTELACHPRGCYRTLPMHNECAHYALEHVAPGIIHPQDAQVIMAVMAPGSEPVVNNFGMQVALLRPKTPYQQVEFWRPDGTRIEDDSQEVFETLLQYLPRQRVDILPSKWAKLLLRKLRDDERTTQAAAN